MKSPGKIILILLLLTALGLRLSAAAPKERMCCTSSSSLEAFPTASAWAEQAEDFTTIQQAINDAENGSTVNIPAGTYYERITINKTISLVGENVSTTVIDGQSAGTVVEVSSDGVSISGFTIRYSGWGWTNNGIYVHYADNCTIKGNVLFMNCHNIRLNYSRGSRVVGNTVEGNGYGIRLLHAENCEAYDNNVSGCIGGIHLEYASNCSAGRNRLTNNDQGVRLYSPCTYNRIFGNVVHNNTYDGMIASMENVTYVGNAFYHNNFNNTNTFICQLAGTIWDNGYPSGGNYWSRYNGTDLNHGPYQNETGSDQIGDTRFSVIADNWDNYPLMNPWTSLPVVNLDTKQGYETMQEAIDSPDTADGHTLSLGSHTFYENVIIHKSLTLVAESPSTAVIDADGTGTVMTINADHVSISGLVLTDSGPDSPPYGDDCGLLLNHSSQCTILDTTITHSRIGLYVYYSENNTIARNTVTDCYEDGIWLYSSGGNTLEDNSMLGNKYNFGVFGNTFKHFNNTIDETNTVDARPVKYVIGAENTVFNSSNTGALYLINCRNVMVQGLNLTGNGHGVCAFNLTDSHIEDTTASHNNYGIHLRSSSNNTIRSCHLTDNWVAVNLVDSIANTVEQNAAERGETGIYLYGASNNTIHANTISSNIFGLRLSSAHSNIIFHNNLLRNAEQADVIPLSIGNAWNNTCEGNYWSDQNSTDANRDGIGDDARRINGDNIDHFPLMGTYSSFSVHGETGPERVAVTTNSTLLGLTFDVASGTITLTVNGTDQTGGFCRICIPHSLVEPEFTVTIDGGSVEVLHGNYALLDNGTHRWMYFAYVHSQHEIVIMPEYGLTALSMIFVISFLCCLAARKLRSARKSRFIIAAVTPER